MSSLASTVRRAWFRMPLAAIAVIAWLGGAALMAMLYLAMHLSGSMTSNSPRTSVGIALIYSVFISLMAVSSERTQRREWSSVDERIEFAEALDSPAAVPAGEHLPQTWRKKLRTIADNKLMGFMPFILMSPLALFLIIMPAANGDPVLPAVLLVAVIFSLAAVGAVLGARRARNAGMILGREHVHVASST